MKSKNYPSFADVSAFLSHLAEQNPGIKAFLPELSGKPFFLLAATGLGKTVVMPVSRLAAMLRDQNKAVQRPQLWVVEPKVFIAQDEAVHMNHLWFEFCSRRGLRHGPLFGCKTKVDRLNVDAPIVFCTTGIFSIYARANRFRPYVDAVLIDEAHETLETDHALELGVGICQATGVRVDCMSATVDEECIERGFPKLKIVRATQKRHCVWRVSTGKTLLNSVADVVRDTLLGFDPKGPYAPPQGHPAGIGVVEALTETDRPRGLLVVVPTYASRHSEAKRVLRLLEDEFGDKLDLALLSGETRRNPELRAEYEALSAKWQTGSRRFVIVATSVVEMGVTLPNVDVVVTTDEAIVGDGEGGTRRGPLGVNALLQRAGRVGRKRAGLLVITRDAGAPYASMTAEELNEPDALAPEAISFPMEQGRLDTLAYHLCKIGMSGKGTLREALDQLRLPSGIAGNLERRSDLAAEIRKLGDAGLLDEGGRLNGRGKDLWPWVGRFDLILADQIINACAGGRHDEWMPCGIAELVRSKLCDDDKEVFTHDLLMRIVARHFAAPRRALGSRVMKTEAAARVAGIARYAGVSCGSVTGVLKLLDEIVDLLAKTLDALVRTEELHGFLRVS